MTEPLRDEKFEAWWGAEAQLLSCMTPKKDSVRWFAEQVWQAAVASALGSLAEARNNGEWATVTPATALPPGHWAAPDEATEGMLKAIYNVDVSLTHDDMLRAEWRAARLAYLNKPETP